MNLPFIITSFFYLIASSISFAVIYYGNELVIKYGLIQFFSENAICIIRKILYGADCLAGLVIIGIIIYLFMCVPTDDVDDTIINRVGSLVLGCSITLAACLRLFESNK